jgi:hypothetical protein
MVAKRARSVRFADCEALLDWVNASLARSANTLAEMSRDMSVFLAKVEARSERIDRLQAENRALLNKIINGG